MPAALEDNLPDQSTHWDAHLQPGHSIWRLSLRELWRYRDLLLLLVRRDFVAFYKQTILGPLWFFIQPIFTTIIFILVFSRMAGISTNGVPPALFYMSGIVAWNYFSECLIKTSTVFKDNSHIFGKIYFPRLIMPLSIILSNLVRFGVQLLLFLALFVYYITTTDQIHPNLYVLLFPVVVLLMALQGLGWGLVITAMTTKYRDLAFLVTFGVQLLMYATPVIYPLSATPARYQALLELNPLSGLIETFRYGLLGAGEFYPGAFLYSVGSSVLVMVIGLLVFNRVEKTFVDTI
ncbi:MAG: ABC transporter permease [Cyclobacteriaceae bacterium]|nr:ABC transporter permease [Cyclobacteriaceae bacterium]